jgi:hypothetical protein
LLINLATKRPNQRKRFSEQNEKEQREALWIPVQRVDAWLLFYACMDVSWKPFM